MAEKYFLIPASLVRKLPILRNAGWWLEAVIVKSLFKLIQTMPPAYAGKFGNSLFRNLKGIFPFSTKIRRNLSIAFPDKDEREIDRLTRNTCGYLGNAAVELALAERIWSERDQRLEFVFEDGVDLASYQGRPAVMITGHIGAWQVTTFVGAYHDLHITSVYAPEENPYLRDFLLSLRKTLCTFISRDGSMRILTKELRQGNLIGLVADARLDSGDLIPFFGVPAPTNTAAARLALRHHCDLLPVIAERLPGMRYRIIVGQAVLPRNPDAATAEQARDMTQQVLERFEAWIRKNPDQWMCFGRRWPHEAYAGTSPGNQGVRQT